MISVCYLYPIDSREEFRQHAQRWVKGYCQFSSGCSHRLLICASNGRWSSQDSDLFKDCEKEKLIKGPIEVDDSYRGNAWDVGEFQYIAKWHDADLMLFMNARTHFWKEGWLKPFVDAFEKFGDKGLYGNSASFEVCSIDPLPWPNPHIRTPCFATSPKVLRRFPFEVITREQAGYFESGRWNAHLWWEERGYPVKLVTRSGCYDKPDWRKPDGIFRRGNQQNCLVWDKHHKVYTDADPATKKYLEDGAGRAEVKLNL